jgi:hypothetical protein
MNQVLQNALAGAVLGGVFGAVAGALVFVFGLLFRKSPVCPDCQTVIPRVRMPRNVRQAMWGGATCPKCGCEVDAKGRKVKGR